MDLAEVWKIFRERFRFFWAESVSRFRRSRPWWAQALGQTRRTRYTFRNRTSAYSAAVTFTIIGYPGVQA